MINRIFTPKAFANDESGLTAIEYGLIAALVGVAIAVGATLLKDDLSGVLNAIGATIAGVAGDAP